jgi:hypothetical protein
MQRGDGPQKLQHVITELQQPRSDFNMKGGSGTNDRNGLFHLLTSETSCYRYWGESRWADCGREIGRRAIEIMRNFPEQTQ